MHELGQFHIGNAAVLLQLVHDADINPVELHRANPPRAARPRAYPNPMLGSSGRYRPLFHLNSQHNMLRSL